MERWAHRARGTTRASDEERDRAVRSLREAFAHGRVDEDELEERIGRAHVARTRGELASLVADLPSGRGGRAARRADRWQRAALRMHASGFALFNGSVVAVWATTGAGTFWPALTLIPGAALLGMHARGSR